MQTTIDHFCSQENHNHRCSVHANDDELCISVSDVMSMSKKVPSEALQSPTPSSRSPEIYEYEIEVKDLNSDVSSDEHPSKSIEDVQKNFSVLSIRKEHGFSLNNLHQVDELMTLSR